MASRHRYLHLSTLSYRISIWKRQFILAFKIANLLLLLAESGCDGQIRPEYNSPPGYDLSKPIRMAMPRVLDEISGIAFNKGISDTVYAEQDEAGKLFHFKWNDVNLITTKFGPKGDYEDVAICKEFVIMLRSDGVFYVFPLSESKKDKAEQVKVWDHLLPPGEYEAMSANEQNGKIFILCKHCQSDKTSKQSSGFIFSIAEDGSLSVAGSFQINVKQIQSKQGRIKIQFRPSGMAEDPVTHNWFIISSVNKLLVIADPSWNVTAVYDLNPAIFVQPEGIAFDKDRNLFISNERNYTSNGTILRFNYKSK